MDLKVSPVRSKEGECTKDRLSLHFHGVLSDDRLLIL